MRLLHPFTRLDPELLEEVGTGVAERGQRLGLPSGSRSRAGRRRPPLGAKAKAVPFEATVDGQGRLTSTIVRIPAAGKTKATRYAITHAGYGVTPTPTAPAADEQQPATKAAYELLNA